MTFDRQSRTRRDDATVRGATPYSGAFIIVHDGHVLAPHLSRDAPRRIAPTPSRLIVDLPRRIRDARRAPELFENRLPRRRHAHGRVGESPFDAPPFFRPVRRE